MRTVRITALITLLATSACRGSSENSGPASGRGGRGPGNGPPPATPVEIVTLTPKPIDQTTEYVGTVKSRESTVIQPQVEGFLTRMVVKSGDHVNAGTLLMEIDSKMQEASIAGLESIKSQREIDVTYARQEAERARKLLEAGASSQMDADRAANALKAAEAQLRTVEEQIRQAKIDVEYYHVTSPTAGTVGDIPVRQGDRVTKSTILTTVEANAGLELYVNVPVQQAAQLRVGLPVRLLDDSGKENARASISFVSPSVDTTTQTVLAKVPVVANSGFRTSQFVRAQVIWTSAPTLTVPVTAVTRINGQFFVFVAEGSDAAGPGNIVARQRAVTLGTVVANEYIVVNGLKAGERLIVSGVQKIGEGAPVSAANAATTGQAPAAANATSTSAPAGTTADTPERK